MRTFPPRNLVLAAVAFASLVAAVTEAIAQSTLIALPSRRDMVFDHSGNYLYISTSDGFVRRYNILLRQLDASYNPGGSLNGLDIAPDDSALIVAQGTTTGSSGMFHRVDLSDGTISNIEFTRSSMEDGAWDVAIASNGLALVTTQSPFYNALPLRQIDLSTNAISERTDAPSSFSAGRVNAKSPLERSADHSRLYLMEPAPATRHFTYDAATNQFGPGIRGRNSQGFSGRAIDRTGSLLALSAAYYPVAFETVPALNYLRPLVGVDGGIAFDATADRFYGVSSPGQIIAYDRNTFLELYRLNIGEIISPGVTQFGAGNLVASTDGRFLALATSSGIRLFELPSGPYPPPPAPIFGTARDMVFDHAGQHLYITTSEGFVWPFELSSGTLGTPYYLGGRLAGADIAFDDSYLIVAQSAPGFAQGAFQKLALGSGQITTFNYALEYGETGGWDVAFGSNGLALATTSFEGEGWTPLRQIDLATAVMSRRSDAPGSGGPLGVGATHIGTQIHRSPDGSRMYLLEAYSQRFTYSADSNTFGPASWATGTHLRGASAAVNRTGNLLATRETSTRLETPPNFGLVRTLPSLVGGVAFDATADIVYGVSTRLSQIIAYDIDSFAERFRFDIGENVNAFAQQFGPGLLVASQDGQYLAFRGATMVRVYRVPAVQLLGVTSSKQHADVAHSLDLPLDGPNVIESRSGGASGNYTMVFTFGQNLTSVGGAAVTVGTGNVNSSMIDNTDPRRYIVNLTGVANRQYLKVTLSDVVDVLGNQTGLISQQMGILIGDTNGNGTVNASDVGEVKAQSGQPVTAANFRVDVTANGGTINASDIGLVKSASGTGLP